EVRQRDHEGGDNRDGQDLVRDSDTNEGDNRNPEQVENGDGHAEALGAEPIEPAKGELALLVRGEQAGTRQEAAPVLLDDLEAAIGPAVALLLERLVAVGQQAPTVAAVGVERAPALLEDRQTEVGVLADRVAGPAAGLLQRFTADQAHG